jgi:2,5-diketo-D-gluconate reductase A
MTTIELNSGRAMPRIGLGVWQVPDDTAADAVATAIAAGYRSIDTAAIYGNERGVGEGIRRAGIARDELFVTTKVWNDRQGYDATLKAFDASLKRLGLDQVDLYLIHWPAPRQDLYLDTWRALERLNAEGRAISIGVSNFHVPHLERLLGQSGVVPALNQIELHPGLQQAELRAFHARHGIATEAWSPLQRGAVDRPEIVAIAARHGRTPAQVILRWHLQLGNIAIPKSVTPSRIRENIAVFDFALDQADMAAIGKLDAGTRTGPNPDTFG